MNLASIIVLLLIAAAVVAAVRRIIKRKTVGSCYAACTGNCEECKKILQIME